MGKCTISMAIFTSYVFFPAEWYDHGDHSVGCSEDIRKLRQELLCLYGVDSLRRVSWVWGWADSQWDPHWKLGIERWNGTFDGDNMMIIYCNWVFIYFQTNAHREPLWKTQTGKPNRFSPLLSTSAKRRLDKSTLKIHCSHPFPFTKIHVWYVFINIWVTSVCNSGQRYVITVILYILCIILYKSIIINYLHQPI